MIQPSLNTRGWLPGPWLSFHCRHQLTGPHHFLDPEFWSLFPPRFGWKSGTSRYLKFSLLPMVFHHVSHEHCHCLAPPLLDPFGTNPFVDVFLENWPFWLSSMISPWYVEESGWLDPIFGGFIWPKPVGLPCSAGIASCGRHRGRGEPCRLRRCWRIWMRPRTGTPSSHKRAKVCQTRTKLYWFFFYHWGVDQLCGTHMNSVSKLGLIMRKSNPAKTSKRGAHWVGPNKLAGTWWCELTDSSSLFRDPWFSYSNLHLQMVFQNVHFKTASIPPCLMHFDGVPMAVQAVQSLWGCFSVHGMAWPGPWDTQKIPIFLDKPTYQISSWIHTHTYIYIYVISYLCVCVCVPLNPFIILYPSKKMEKRFRL